MTFPRYPDYKDSGVEWLGEVPGHWAICSIKRITDLRSGETINAESISETEEYPVFGGNGLRGFTQGYTHDGFFPLIGRQGALCGNINYAQGKFWASEHAVVVSCREGINRIWLGETLRAMNLNQYSVSAAQPGLSVDIIKNLVVPFPPATEQRAIATFLDRETAKIDALVTEQERLIALLKEKRQAVISHAVTKGLDPNVRMKDSGVEWLGEVPEHWDVMALKRLIAAGSSISYGIVQPGDPVDDGVPFIQTTNMSSGRLSLDDLQKTSKEIADNYPRSRLFGGEVLLGIRASIGASHIVPPELEGTNLSRGVARIECGPLILNNFLLLFLRSNAAEEGWQHSKQGSTFNEISIDTVRNSPIPIPPLSEQSQIICQLERETQKFNRAVEVASYGAELLRVRRSALISAAVTGKIDVRGLVPTEEAA